MLAAYFDQFNVVNLITIWTATFYGGYLTFSFTNSSLMMLFVIILFWSFFKVNYVIPNKWQSILELINTVIQSMIKENLGAQGKHYFSFVFCLFIFIGLLNVLGLFPYVFTPTTHIIITFGLSFSIVLGVTILGVLKFKIDFMSMFMPGGVLLMLAPFLVIIETISYVTRAISLGLRLAANISAGHLLFAIFSGFVFDMLTNGLRILSIFPVLVMIFITILEMAVAVIQAYVFCLLTTIYLGDTIALH
uniref:ATP synthase subunit a n=1 Tax=Plakina trilopha TaxID=764034 RepID=E7DNM0_PLATI|nr:ATP synthase F0 subunit 6 [Plakina trilopha]